MLHQLSDPCFFSSSERSHLHFCALESNRILHFVPCLFISLGFFLHLSYSLALFPFRVPLKRIHSFPFDGTTYMFKYTGYVVRR